MSNSIKLVCTAAIPAVLMCAGSLLAQDAELGRSSTFSFGSTVDTELNPDFDIDETDSTGSLTLDLGYLFSLRTRTTALTFDLSTSVFDTDDSQFFNDPSLDIDFTHEASRQTLDFSISHRRTDVSDELTTDLDDSGNFNVIETSGERERNSFSARFEAGKDRPFGYDLSYAATKVRYSDTISTSLFDTDRETYSLGLRADISSNISTNLLFSHTDFSAENITQTNRQTDTVSLGADVKINSITDLSLSIGSTNIDTETTGGFEELDGGTFSLDLTREVPLGEFGLSFESNLRSNGRQETLTVSHAADLPRGSWAGAIGASRTESGEVDLVGSLDLTLVGRDQVLDLGFSRAVNISDDSERITRTQADGSWTTPLSQASDLNVGLSALLREDDISDTLLFSGSLTYGHQLTRSTNLAVGLSASFSQEDTGPLVEEATSGRLFVSLTHQLQRRH